MKGVRVSDYNTEDEGGKSESFVLRLSYMEYHLKGIRVSDYNTEEEKGNSESFILRLQLQS